MQVFSDPAVAQVFETYPPALRETRGSTIRIDAKKKQPSKVAMYFNCQTSLISTFRTLFPSDFTLDGHWRIHRVRRLAHALGRTSLLPVRGDRLAPFLSALAQGPGDRSGAGSAACGLHHPGSGRNRVLHGRWQLEIPRRHAKTPHA